MRADDIVNQQNILRDIVESIYSSDLIVVDLTGLNPNVFYELGLAHAFQKPVILLTQDISEVPFDLKSYILLEYSVHFAQISIAKNKLEELARGSISGQTKFGSPVTDFLAGVLPNGNAISRPLITGPVDDRGLLDHLDDLESGYTRISEIITELTGDMQAFPEAIQPVVDSIQSGSKNQAASNRAHIRNRSRKLAEFLGQFALKLRRANTEYESIVNETDNSLEFIVSFRSVADESVREQLEEQINSIRELQQSAASGSKSMSDLAETMDQTPRLERHLNREIVATSGELRRLASNIDQSVASMARAIEIGERLIDQN